MKKLIAMGAALAIAASSVPAYADNSEEVIIGVLGGFIGGLVVGGAARHHNEHLYDEEYYEERRPVRRVHRRQACRVHYYEEYVPGYGYQVLREYRCR